MTQQLNINTSSKELPPTQSTMNMEILFNMYDIDTQGFITVERFPLALPKRTCTK